jgi:hypothetical protein
MAEITSRRRGELVRGVFAVLMDKPDGLPAAQVLKAVEQLVPPSEFEQTRMEALTPTGKVGDELGYGSAES